MKEVSLEPCLNTPTRPPVCSGGHNLRTLEAAGGQHKQTACRVSTVNLATAKTLVTLGFDRY